MNEGQRTVRTRPRNGLAIADLLSSALVSELLDPSSELWLVTGWVSDIVVLENDGGRFDALFPESGRSGMTLSEVFIELMRRGSVLHIAVREDDHNVQFIERLERGHPGEGLHVYTGVDLHEKILCGWAWLMKGSMNFTWNGVSKNEESIDFVVNQAEAAKQRLELHTRWRGLSDV